MYLSYSWSLHRVQCNYAWNPICSRRKRTLLFSIYKQTKIKEWHINKLNSHLFQWSIAKHSILGWWNEITKSTRKMDKRPGFSSRVSNTRQNRRIWKWDHFTFGDGIHRMATNGTYLSSFCYKKHVIGPQKLNEACKNQATMSSRIILIFHLNAQKCELRKSPYQ